MGRRHVVTELTEPQLDFVIRRIVDGDTDREVCAKFEDEFTDATLAKSSLQRWRVTAGKELIERYQLARFQAKALLEDLGKEDLTDKYQEVIATIEDRLLTATRDVIRENPMKLLYIRQEEEKLRLKRDELDLKKTQHEFEREKFEKTQSANADRFKIGAETWRFVLSWFNRNEPSGADLLTNASDKLLNELEQYLENQIA